MPPLCSYPHSTTTEFGHFLVSEWPPTLLGIWPLQLSFMARWFNQSILIFSDEFLLLCFLYWFKFNVLHRLRVSNTQDQIRWFCTSLAPPIYYTLSADTPSLCESLPQLCAGFNFLVEIIIMMFPLCFLVSFQDDGFLFLFFTQLLLRCTAFACH